MATSTFTKQFEVKKKKSDLFLKEMTRSVPPTLDKDFKSNLKPINDYEEQLKKALK